MSTASFPGEETNHVKWITHPTRYESKPEKCSEKLHSINRSRTVNNQSWNLGPHWQSSWAHWTEFCFCWNPRSCTPLSLLPSPCQPPPHPSSLLESSLGSIRLAWRALQRRSQRWLRVAPELCLLSSGNPPLEQAPCLALGPCSRLVEGASSTCPPCAHLSGVQDPWGSALPAWDCLSTRCDSAATCDPRCHQREQECAAPPPGQDCGEASTPPVSDASSFYFCEAA